MKCLTVCILSMNWYSKEKSENRAFLEDPMLTNISLSMGFSREANLIMHFTGWGLKYKKNVSFVHQIKPLKSIFG